MMWFVCQVKWENGNWKDGDCDDYDYDDEDDCQHHDTFVFQMLHLRQDSCHFHYFHFGKRDCDLFEVLGMADVFLIVAVVAVAVVAVVADVAVAAVALDFSQRLLLLRLFLLLCILMFD